MPKSSRLTVTAEVVSDISSSLVLDEVLTSIAQRTCEVLEVWECDLYGWIAPEEQVSCLAVWAREPHAGDAEWVGARLSLTEQPTFRRVLREGRMPAAYLDDPGLPQADRERMEAWGERSSLLVPLIFKTEVIGCLQLIEKRRQHLFSARDRELAATLAEQAAVAIRNARQYELLEHTTTQLASQVELRQVLLELSGTLLTTLDHADVFSRIATLVKRVVDYDCLEIRLVDPEAEQLYCAYASAAEADYLENWRSSLDEGVSGWVVRHNEAQLVNDMPGDPRVAVVAGTEPDPQASILVPLTVDGTVIGVLALDRSEGRTFDEHELEPAQLFANLSAIAIQNSRRYEDVRRIHASNLRTLCTALNAKDYYTLGHTARVATYMIMLGRELGWSDETVQVIGEAAYLHDIGKIGISDRILTKAGKLNDREWAMMRQHPGAGARLLRRIGLDSLADAVAHHHERFDGTGYPAALSGREIPLAARIVAVAAAFQALLNDRPYRAAQTVADALEEMRRCTGTQFDPDVVAGLERVVSSGQDWRGRGTKACL